MTTRRSILFVAADVPWPPDGGGRIASLHVLEAFGRQFDVDVIALADPFRETDFEPLRSRCRRLEIIRHPFTFGQHRVRQTAVAVRSLASSEPYRIRKFRSRRMAETIARWKTERRYDLVHHEQLGVARYHDAALPSTALVQNVESQIYRLGRRSSGLVSRVWATIEGAKLARREPALLKRFDEVLVLSEGDRLLLAGQGLDRISVIPMPGPEAWPARAPVGDPRILSLGSMSWFGVADGLRWFQREVWPIVVSRLPEARWDLIGPGATQDVRAFEQDTRVTVHGYVESIRPHVERARVAIVPLRIGGGIRMKLLDFMAWGLPSVSTSIGAQGLSFEEGEGCIRRDAPEAFSDAIVQLLSDDQLWLETAHRGRAYLARAHGLDEINTAIAAAAERAVRHHAARARP